VFNLISKKKAVQSLAPVIQAYQQLSIQQAYNSNLGYTVYGYNNKTDQVNAYATVGDLYSIVNKLSKTAAMIPIYEYVVTDQKAYSQYKTYLKKCLKRPTNENIYELKKLQTKALELAGEDSELQYFLDHPNKFQSKTEFYQLTFLFKLLTGNYYIYKEILDAGANQGKVYEMYNMPPNYTFPIASKSLPRRVEGYNFTLYNYTQLFTIDQIMHGKYANPVFDFMGNELIGLSPLSAGAKVLTTIANETDYANQALKNAGAGGVIVNEDPADLSMEALGNMKDDVLRELGSAWQGNSNVNVNKLGFLAGKWNYLKLFIDPANMQLLEQARFTFKRLCNLYGIGDKLFNNDQGLKYDNYDIALRELYTNATLPLVGALCDDFNAGLTQHFQSNSVIGYDVSDIPELQENQADVINRFANAPAFRVNDLYEAMGYGRLDDPSADVVLVKQGYAPLDEVATSMNMNLDQLGNANDYNPPGSG
jgi:HK97 family phage portal protein